MASARRHFLATLGGLCLAGCATSGSKPAIPALTVPSKLYDGEASVAAEAGGSLFVDVPVGGIARLDIAFLERGLTTLRPGGREAVIGLGTPSLDGMLPFLTAAPGGRRYAVRVLSGGVERILVEGQGDPLWDRPLTGLAMSPDGHRVAWVRQPGEEVRRHTPLNLGRVVVRDGATSDLIPLPSDPWLDNALGQAVGWLPDSRRLVFAAAGPEGRKVSPAPPPSAQPDPMVCILDAGSGKVVALTKGHSPIASTDGKSVLVARGRGMSWGTVDVASGKAQRLSGIPGLVRPLGCLASRHLVFLGQSSASAPEGYTTNNSPLVGPKRMLSVKVMDLRSGARQTLLDGVDPRRLFVVS